VARTTKSRANGQTNGHAAQTVGIDELSGAWNRAGFVAAANPLFVSCQRRGAPVALAYFDLHASDRAQSVEKDAAVDRVVVALAEQLRKAFRASDVIGRVDTACLAVLLSDCTDAALEAVHGVRALEDEATTRFGLTLTAGIVRSTTGGTLHKLMLDAAARVKELKRT
jgi:GGDEF domain-containing protein